MDTIFALASARGKAGVSVVRISGPRAFSAMERLTGITPMAPDRRLAWVRNAAGERLDQALCLSFAKGASFTGECVVELHLHGSLAILSAVLSELGATDGLRLADPGEFTRRALENDRLDLAQIEGLGDLIEAETEAQRRQAQRVFSGALGAKIELWRKDLIRAAALVEAVIDFADEEVPENVTPEVYDLLIKVRAGVAKEVAGASMAERIRDGFEVAIVGAPNAGKSTLLNRIAGREAALTSEFAGTTRDIVEVRMDLNGLPVTLLDTAGLRETDDPVEAMGVRLAKNRAASADLRVFLISEAAEVEALEAQTDDIIAFGKADMLGTVDFLAVSGQTGEGVDLLLRNVSEVLVDRAASAGLAIRQRHFVAMTDALGSLDAALAFLQGDNDEDELVAHEIRGAVVDLDSVIGRIDVEDILDEIFSSFCLGK